MLKRGFSPVPRKPVGLIFQDAKDLSSNIEKGKDKAKSDKSTKEAL
ncbi:hypothetical protein GZ243_002962 [Listeria monocytogenes]|nr:hypothetical protein [Listeria monocytogenes]